MFILTSIKKIFNLKNILYTVLFAVIPGILFYALAFSVLRSYDYSTMEILRDFAQQVEKSSFLGFLSSVGAWVWVASFAIASFVLFAGLADRQNRHRELLFLLATFSILLGVDDFFMIHDRYLDQRYCYGTYMVLAILLLIRHFKQILEINAFAFMLAGSLLALSILTDLMQDELPFGYENVQILEEAFKFTGAVTWLFFIALASSFKIEKAK